MKIKLLIILFVLMICSPYLYNNLLLSRFKSELITAIELMDNTKILKTVDRIGVLWGNSNHCDMQIISFIESDLNYKEFYDFMSTVKIRGPFRDDITPLLFVKNGLQFIWFNESSENIELYSVFTQLPLDLHLDNDEIEILESFKPINSEKNHYIIMVNDQTYRGFSMLDFRSR